MLGFGATPGLTTGAIPYPNIAGPSAQYAQGWWQNERQKEQLAEQSREFNIRMKFYQQQLDLQKQAFTTGGGALTSMLNEYNTAFAQAKADSENRYNQQLGVANTLGGQRQADIISTYQQNEANVNQQLKRTGLYNPLSASANAAVTKREQNAELNRLAEQIGQQKIGIMQNKKDYIPSENNIKTMADYLAAQFANYGKVTNIG